MNDPKPVFMCLTCGYVQKGKWMSKEYAEDKQHARRCNFFMMIRYVTKHGIVGGTRRAYNGRPR